MNKPDLALNNLQWLIWHKTEPNQCSSSQFHSLVFHGFLDKLYVFVKYLVRFESLLSCYAGIIIIIIIIIIISLLASLSHQH